MKIILISHFFPYNYLPLIINIILAFLISPHKCKIEIKLNTIGCGAGFLTKEKNLKQKMVKIRAADPLFFPFWG